RDSWFNLAAVQLAIHDSTSACESFYKAHRLSDPEALKYLNQYCKEFMGDSIKSKSDIDIFPKYIFENKEYPLFEKEKLNSHYIKILTKALKASKILKMYQKGKLIVAFYIDRNGNFQGNVILDGARDKSKLVKDETLRIFSKLVKYTPALYQDENIEILENWTLPINF